MSATFDAWAARAAVLHRDHPRTVATYRYQAAALARAFGDRAREAPVTLAEVEAWKLERLGTGHSPGTVNDALVVLGQVLRWGQAERGGAPPPPLKRLRQERRKVPKLLEDDAVAALITTAEATPTFARILPFLELAAYAGLRRDEIRWLRWEDVSLARGVVLVRAKPGWSPKSGEREVPIDQGTVEALKRHRERAAAHVGESPWVAPYWWAARGLPSPLQRKRSGGQWHPNRLGDVVLELFGAAGVERPPLAVHTLHMLRGTYAVNLLRGGADLETVRDLLGHADLATTAVYLSATSASKRRAVAGLRVRQ